MKYIVEVKVTWPVTTVSVEDAKASIPIIIKVRGPEEFPLVEATAEITEQGTGTVTKLVLR